MSARKTPALDRRSFAAPFFVRWAWLVPLVFAVVFVGSLLILQIPLDTGGTLPLAEGLMFLAVFVGGCLALPIALPTSLHLEGSELRVSSPLRSTTHPRFGIVAVRVIPLLEIVVLRWADGHVAYAMTGWLFLTGNTRGAIAAILHDNPSCVVRSGRRTHPHEPG